MAYVQADRVQETTTTIGTGTVTLAGAVTGYRTFASQMVNGDTCYYVIVDPATGAWETGIGTWGTGGTLARTTLLDSSTGSAVSFAAGSKYVLMAQPAKGALIMPAATSSQPSAIVTPGSAPSSPANGHMWLTAAGLWMYYGGNTYGPFLAPTSGVTTLEYNAGSPALVLQNLSTAGYAPALIRLGRRGAGDTATPNGSAVGEFRFEIKDSTNAYQLAATIGCSIGTNAAGGAPTDLTFATSQGAAGLANALTLGSDQRAVFFGTIMPMTGTTSKAPIDFASGSLLTTPSAGAMEYDGTTLAFTPNSSSGRTNASGAWEYRLSSDRTLSNGTSVQSIFNVGLTLPIGTYRVEMFIMLGTGSTSCVINAGVGGTATWTATDFTWRSSYFNRAAQTPTGTLDKWNDTLTNGTMQAVSVAAGLANRQWDWRGTVTTSGAGTFIPQMSFSAAPGGTNVVKKGSWVRITPMPNSGAWA